MKFDYVIGNPPYNLEDGGHGKSSKPIYHFFVNEAKKIANTSITYIVPAKWYAGGKGLDQFRSDMLSDKCLKKIVDFENYKDVFPNLGGLAGGLCIFQWNKNYSGYCEIENYHRKKSHSLKRSLNEFDTFIRQNQAVEIVRKINNQTKNLDKLSNRVSSRKPFGLPTNYKPRESGIPCQFVQKIGLKYANPEDVNDKFKIQDKWKLVVPKAPIAGQTDFSKPIRIYHNGNTTILPPGTVCTESFIVLYSSSSEKEVKSFKTYLFTKTVRYLLLQSVISQDITKERFKFVPDLNHYIGTYSDQRLKEMWKLSDDQMDLIDSKILDS